MLVRGTFAAVHTREERTTKFSTNFSLLAAVSKNFELASVVAFFVTSF